MIERRQRRSAALCCWAPWLFILATLAGCEGQDAAVAPRAVSSSGELPWSEQVANVQSGASREIAVADLAIGDAQFAELAPAAANLEKLSLEHTQLSNTSLAALVDFPRLEHLVLRQAAIDDEGLALIARVKSLKRINLPQADGTDDGLARLAALPDLEQLRMGGKRLTGKGLAAFEDHKRLRFLHLIDAPITDEALESIAHMPALESLYLDGAATTDAGMEKLFQARPKLHIHLNQEHHDRDPHGHDHSHEPN